MANLLYLMSFLGEAPPVGPMADINLERDLHLTLLPCFGLRDSNLPIFRRGLAAVARWFPPLALVPTGQATLGTDIPVRVSLVDPHHEAPYSLACLHGSVLALVEELGGAFRDPFVGPAYKPHVSHWAGECEALIDSMSLVWHREAFGEDVVVLANYGLSAPIPREVDKIGL